MKSWPMPLFPERATDPGDGTMIDIALSATCGPLPLLRAPPFHRGMVSISHDCREVARPPSDMFDRLAKARIGGTFWESPIDRAAAGAAVIRLMASDDAAKVRAQITGHGLNSALWITQNDIDPWSALEGAGQLVAHGADEWVAIARLLCIPVRILSAGHYGVPGETMEAIDARVQDALGCLRFQDPFTGNAATLETMIDLLAEWRRLIDANRQIGVACGMAWWKRDVIRRFLWVPGRSLPMTASTSRALALVRKTGGSIAIWPSRVSQRLLAKARNHAVQLIRVEDGFVRSIGLGSDLVPPSSVVVDRLGIHFDPTGPSDLEHILATTEFTPRLEQRAQALRDRIVSTGISKYAAGLEQQPPPRQHGRRLVLVPAQVEDDLSVLAGGGGLHSNLELLCRVRQLEPDAEIWFRPHPDVDAGHRKGAVKDELALQYADRIVRGGGMAHLLDAVDAVHVLTSLTGFEALMRGREVTCHGVPFFSGWGLTHDLGQVPDRRGRKLTLDQLVAGVLILYPRYLDPVTGLPCPPEILVNRLAEARALGRTGWIQRLRRWQGRFMAKLR